jgi:hypothetical protein
MRRIALEPPVVLPNSLSRVSRRRKHVNQCHLRESNLASHVAVDLHQIFLDLFTKIWCILVLIPMVFTFP